MNKATQSAINETYPLRWEADGIGGFGVKLVATTYTYETGKVRERKVFRTFSRKTARAVDAEVREAEYSAIDLSYSWDLCAALMREHLWDPDDLITETCEAFEAKHLGVQA